MTRRRLHSLTRTLPSQSPTPSHFPCLLMSKADPGTFSACTCVPQPHTTATPSWSLPSRLTRCCCLSPVPPPLETAAAPCTQHPICLLQADIVWVSKQNTDSINCDARQIGCCVHGATTVHSSEVERFGSCTCARVAYIPTRLHARPTGGLEQVHHAPRASPNGTDMQWKLPAALPQQAQTSLRHCPAAVPDTLSCTAQQAQTYCLHWPAGSHLPTAAAATAVPAALARTLRCVRPPAPC